MSTKKSDVARAIIKEMRTANAAAILAANTANAIEGAEQIEVPAELKFNTEALVARVVAEAGVPNKALAKAYTKNNWDKALEPPKPVVVKVVDATKGAKGKKGTKKTETAVTETAETSTEKVAEAA